MPTLSTALASHIDASRDRIVELQRELVARPAVGPENGGAGEFEKAAYLEGFLKQIGSPAVQRIDVKDPRAPSGVRPNLLVTIPGADRSRTFWVLAHTDVVPEGDRSLWKTDPFQLEVDGDRLIGRGVCDNHQGLVSGLLVAEALLECGVTPPVNYGLVLVADEESGSDQGLKYLLEHHPDLFGDDDLFLVPDFGEPDGSAIELAEKHMLWLRFVVEGRQCHASAPSLGRNTLVAMSDLVLQLRGLYDRFPAEDPIYFPPTSTFESTRVESNVENINTIPGRTVFSMDCRILPRYEVDGVLAAIREQVAVVEKQHEVHIVVEVDKRVDAAPATPATGPIAQAVKRAVEEVCQVQPRFTGLGGGTVAAPLRERGYQAVVWSTLFHTAHMPNEYSSISNTMQDARVMAHVLCQL